MIYLGRIIFLHMFVCILVIKELNKCREKKDLGLF